MQLTRFPKNRVSRIVNEIFRVAVIPLCLLPFAVSRAAEYQLPNNGNTIFAQPANAEEGNKVLINDSVTSGGWAIIGGYTSGADAGWNKIIANDVAKDIQIGMSILGGLKQAGTGAANSNEIYLANSGGTITVSGDIRGGFNQGTGDANGNEIHLENTTVTGSVQGGIASIKTGNTLANVVSIENGRVDGAVAGGYIDNGGSGRADRNQVSLRNASVGGNIEGSFNLGTGESSASQNEVTITVDNTAADDSGFEVGGFVAGGVISQTGEGNANSNKVTVTNTSAQNFLIKSYVAGGYNQGTGDANGNEIHLENTTVTGAVQGGVASHMGDTLENKVTITGGSVAGSVAGGYIDGMGSGKADGNQVSLAGTGVVQGITGGLNYGSGKSSASSNKVFINHVEENTDPLNGAAEGPAFRTGESLDVSPDETGEYVVGGHISYMSEGDTNDNHVIINNAHVKQYIVGGENEGSDSPDVTVPSGQSNANNNTVYLENAELSEYTADGAVIPRHYVVGGLVGSQKNGNANGNAVTLVNSRFTGKYIAAGLNQGTGETAGNTVRLENSTVQGIVAGGLDWGSGKVNLTDNHVIIQGGNVIRDLTEQGDGFRSAMAIAGARSLEGENVEKNMVSLGQTEIVGNVAGGANQEGGNARENVVTITGSTIQGYVGGGYIDGTVSDNGEEGHSDGNTVTITNTHVKALKMENGDVVNDGNIGGGYNQGIGTVSADNNNISISVEDNEPIVGMKAGETDTRFDVEGFVAGGVIGQNGTGSTNGNTVTIINSSTRGKTLHIGNYVAGGYNEGTSTSTSTGNTVRLEASGDVQLAVDGFVIGGYVRSGEAGNTDSNTVTITNGAVGDVNSTSSYVAGGLNDGTGSASGNRVVLAGNTIVRGSGVIGGSVTGATNNAGEQDAFPEKREAGYSTGTGQNEESADLAVVRNNTVMVSDDVRVEGGRVAGGESVAGQPGKSGIATIESNTVTVNGGVISADVYGGTAVTGRVLDNTVNLNGGTLQGKVFAGNSSGIVQNNTVNLDGKNGIDITGAWLIGSGQHVATGQNGNTLNIRNFKGRAQNIGNFDRIDLDLAGLTLHAGDPIIVLTEKETTRLGNSTIHIHTDEKPIAATDSDLVDRYEVIKNETGAGLTAENVTYEKGQITVRQNGALQALYKVEWDGTGIDSVDGDSIDLVKTGETEVVPGTEIVNESRLALTDFLNAAGDFVLDRKLQCSLREDGSIPETCFYGAVSGGDLHHDLNGDKAWAHTTGTHWFIGLRSKLNEKQDTEKDINGALYAEAGWGNVDTHNRWARGDGDIHYYGIGVIGERKQKKGDWKGAYLQAHARIGRAFSDYNSRLKDGSGEKLDYDKNSTYYGAGFEIGREWQYHPDYMLDSYLKYRWLHLNGFNAEMNRADYHLDDIDSHRIRLGSRLNYTAEKTSMPYIGLAWEHEFDGNARGSVMGYSLKDTSLKGDSGVLELGVKFVPSEKSRWNYDFTIEGYIGQREGIMGNFVVNYLF